MRLVLILVVSSLTASAVAAPAAKTKLPKLHLAIEAPGAKVGTFTDGAYRVSGSKVGDLEVRIDKIPPASEADVKKDTDILKPTNWRFETLSDGMAVQFETAGSDGSNYFVGVCRMIGDVHYRCGTRAKSAEIQTAAYAACKSLAKS